MKTNQQIRIQCHNEYDTLTHVVVAPPEYMAITEVINETQSHYATENIDIETAIIQHRNLVHTLEEAGAVVSELAAEKELNEQVFTRDIGFVIGEQLFTSHMARDIRKKELPPFEKWLQQENIDFKPCNLPSIEGGDVIIDGKLIWLGISSRTSFEAAHALQAALPNHKVIPVQMRPDILHLDCVFNVIRDDTALIYPEAISSEDVEKMKKHYTLVEVTEEEQFAMGPNVLAIGNETLISLPENERLNNILRQADFIVKEVPFSEIIKSGGSYRCCTLPLTRK